MKPYNLPVLFYLILKLHLPGAPDLNKSLTSVEHFIIEVELAFMSRVKFAGSTAFKHLHLNQKVTRLKQQLINKNAGK